MRVIFGFLGLALLTVVGLQVFRAGEASGTETALFGAMQLIFSLGIGWFASQKTSKEDFIEKQRQFARSAYRRIREVESTVSRMISDLQKSLAKKEMVRDEGLRIALVRAEEILETTESSKLDWADVIGEEISKVEELERIRRKSTRVESSRHGYIEDEGDRFDREGAINLQKEMMERFEEIKKSLPNDFKLIADLDNEKPDTEALFDEEFKEKGCVELTGFADLYQQWDLDVAGCCPGQEITISLEDTNGRIGSFVVRDKSGRSLGSIINKYESKYSDFSMGLCQSACGMTLNGTVTDISSELVNDSRRYFTLKVYENEGV